MSADHLVHLPDELPVRAEHHLWSISLVDSAKLLAQDYGLAAMDAIHLAVAIAAQADVFISGERLGKPLFRVREIATQSLWETNA
ncbi:hypothetical protein Thivi_0104 [Thiocystis violascens DSM 198]|uniref:PIN domain-containing protein n=1 Tax=Thiocystis violascens (strain ATCC 17096 / DSM 198 / 6111) TaxID=765911 RepID=I3Y5C1_THIV6|nr:hypothetical protein Thivi_0104 [Thiocystis violascens DSM 198]